ncbi:hypothetical protein ACTZWW_04365 [Salinarimonas sp. NSM]|uniref:hypothetical protein n=1 Tax=Salinarimonas sp. NSM TaxID=3458003 RepID=UPI00403756E7
MNVPVIAPNDTLPTLIDRATAALASARTSGEVLEARDMARMAYDAAKSAARIMKAKEAHDSLIADVHRAQAHALAIRARAEMRLAEEYDIAQEGGEVARPGNPNFSEGEKLPSARDVGLQPKDLHEARVMRDAERAEPGVIQRTINRIVERGEEPTRAALKREIAAKPQPKPMNPKALWLWGRLKDFEREGVLDHAALFLLNEMTAPMREDVRRLAPRVREFLQEVEAEA